MEEIDTIEDVVQSFLDLVDNKEKVTQDFLFKYMEHLADRFKKLGIPKPAPK